MEFFANDRGPLNPKKVLLKIISVACSSVEIYSIICNIKIATETQWVQNLYLLSSNWKWRFNHFIATIVIVSYLYNRLAYFEFCTSLHTFSITAELQNKRQKKQILSFSCLRKGSETGVCIHWIIFYKVKINSDMFHTKFHSIAVLFSFRNKIDIGEK